MHFLEYAGHAELRGTRPFEVERRAEKIVGTFVCRLLQKRGQLWGVPTISSEQRVLASRWN